MSWREFDFLMKIGRLNWHDRNPVWILKKIIINLFVVKYFIIYFAVLWPG